MKPPTLVDQIFSFLTRNRQRVINTFKISYLACAALLLFGGFAIYKDLPIAVPLYAFSIWAGRIALVLYILTTIPGIARRFRFVHKLVSLLMIYRRYIGILMYFFVLLHFWFIAGIDIFFRGMIPASVPFFQLMGTLAYYLTFLLFITSNDWSTKKLGIWWHRIHGITYVIIWLIFLHVYLQSISIWSVLIGTTLLLQIASFIAKYMRQFPKKGATS